MFSSGNFYVEFFNRATKSFCIIAGNNGERVYRSSLKEKNPTALYRDGNYYNFIDEPIPGKPLSFNRRLLILPKDEIDSPILDSAEGWQNVRHRLALPDELAIFYWEDPHRTDSGFGKPVYSGSYPFEYLHETYDCDSYTVDIKNLAGSVIAQQIYRALYKNGQLNYVNEYFLRDGLEIIQGGVYIKNISLQVPDKAFAIQKKIKIYNPHNGDMDDLTGVYQEVGEIGGKSK